VGNASVASRACRDRFVAVTRVRSALASVPQAAWKSERLRVFRRLNEAGAWNYREPLRGPPAAAPWTQTLSELQHQQLVQAAHLYVQPVALCTTYPCHNMLQAMH